MASQIGGADARLCDEPRRMGLAYLRFVDGFLPVVKSGEVIPSYLEIENHNAMLS